MRIHKFSLIPIILGLGVQAFVSCTLKFPEEAELSSSSSVENSSSSSAILSSSSSSSNQNSSAGSSSAGNQSSSSLASGSSSSGNALSSSGTSQSSSSVSSSSGNILSSSSSLRSSSSSIPSSSSVCTASDNTETKYCSGGAMKDYGTVSDGSQSYKTVVIGTQTWMAENLNYTPTSGKHKCYAEDKEWPEPPWLSPSDPKVKANCDKYGRLYDWATAMNLPANCNSSSCKSQINTLHKGVCPTGWHLPDSTDWATLRKFIADEIFNNYEDIDFGWDVGTKLKAITGWKEASTTDYGVDSYGFNAIGSGYCVFCEELSSATGYYSGEKEEAHWWSATEYINPYTNDATKAYKSKISYNKIVMNQETEKKADYLYSVRCIKN